MNQQDYISILPEIVLSVFGMLVMLVDPLIEENASRKPLGLLAFVGAALAMAASFFQACYVGSTPYTAFHGTVRIDGFSIFFHILICAIAAIAILGSFEYLDVQGIRGGE